MEIEYILFSILFLLAGVLIPFYILDVLRLKKIKKSFTNNNFFERLKIQMINQMLGLKKVLFFICIGAFALMILLIMISPFFYNWKYSSIINDSSLSNKTLEEKERLVEMETSTFLKLFSLFKIYFFGASILAFLIYFYSKLKSHFIIEESLSKGKLNSFLENLGVSKSDIDFYEAIEKKFGRSRKKEVYESFSDFIYNTLDYNLKKSKK